jgi:hypothetical protein
MWNHWKSILWILSILLYHFRPLRLTSPFLQRTWDGFVFVQSPLDCGCPLDGKLRCFPHENMVEANYTKKKITWVSLALLGQREAFLPLLMDWGIRMSQDPTVVALENDLNISTGSCQSTFPMARLRMCKHDVKARFKFGCHTRVGRWWMASGHYNNVIDVSSHWLPVSKAIVSGTPNVLHGKWNLPIQLWSNCSACLSLCVILWCHVHTCICHISSSVFLIWCPFSTVEYICLWWLSSHLWDKPPYWPLLVCLWWQ